MCSIVSPEGTRPNQIGTLLFNINTIDAMIGHHTDRYEHYGWAASNFGGALEFDDKGYLYITIGDRGEDVLSQRNEKLEGKILRLNADGSTTIYFSSKQPEGMAEGNWIQTDPKKGWFTILRLYSPLQSFFDKSWRPSEIELVK